MLSDVRFRRTAGCKMFESTIFPMKLNKFPIQEVDCENMDLDDLMIKSEFSMPFVVKGISEKLGIKVLPRENTLSDVADVIGRSFPIKMIEVAEQSEIEGKLGDYADYLKGYTPLHKIINMISLEFSTTSLSNVVQALQFVRDIDWIDTVWPLDRKLTNDYPKVQKYCLSGMASSYTDFHIDFGGTSVWYHVVNGRKRFYLIAPTLRNLQLFKKWSVSSTQADTFFGDVVGRAECFEYDLTPGDTFMIPSGWIHAVFTPEDSLVFGGNFLHKNAILRQMQVYQIEGNTRVGKKYRFPLFRQINWYTLCMVLPLALGKYCPQLTDQSLDELDTSDYDPEVIKMSENLNTSHLFHQFLFLVRICDEWVASLSDQYEIEKFVSIAKEYAEMDVMYDVIQKWWAVLESVAVLLDAESETDSARPQSNLDYLRYIRYLEGQVDLLDEQVVSRTLSSFDNQVQSIYASLNYTPNDAPKVAATAAPAVPEEKLSLTLKLRPKATPVKSSEESSGSDKQLVQHIKHLPGENPFSDTSSNTSSYQETLPSTVIDSEYSGEGADRRKGAGGGGGGGGGGGNKEVAAVEPEPLSPPPPPADLTSLKFKLPRSSRPTPAKDSAPAPVTSTAVAAPVVIDVKPSLFSFDLGHTAAPAVKPQASSTSSATSEVPAIPVPLGLTAIAAKNAAIGNDDVIPRPIGREEALKLRRIQEKNKAREILTAAESSGATTSSAASSKPTRYKITMSASKPVPAREKPVSNTVGVKTETEGQRKYGTRGLKLSTDFLKNAMDVDFAESDPKGQQQQQPLQEEPEEEEEEEFHFVDAESRLKGGDEYSEDSEGDEGDDGVEYDSGEDEDHREFSGRKATGGGGATTGEEEDEAFSGSDDEERVRRRKTNKRTQADRLAAKEASARPAPVKAGGSGVKRRLSAGDREDQQPKKPFVVDRVSYNSYMGIPQNQPILSSNTTTTSSVVAAAPSAASFPQARAVVKPKGGRSAIMKKLGIHR